MEDTNQINTHSVTALTLGILSIFIPFIGLILGILGIMFYRKSIQAKELGRGMAIAGFICSVVGIVFQLLMGIGLFAFMFLTVEVNTVKYINLFYL